MNPFTYARFQEDMNEAVKDFVLSTDYKIISITNSGIKLSNGKKSLVFFLDGSTLCSEIQNIDGSGHYSLYEIYLKEGMLGDYPKDINNEYEYEDWNRHCVSLILNMMKKYLPQYL